MSRRSSRPFKIFTLSTLVALAASMMPARASALEPGAVCVQAAEKGQDARERGALRTARAHFVTCAADACPKAMRVDCARWLEELDASIPTIVVGARDGSGADLFDVRVKVDGEPVEDVQAGRPIVLDPGPHVVRFERGKPPSVEVREMKVLLRTGERNRSVVATMVGREGPVPAETDAGKASHVSTVPTASWIFGGIGVLALGSFGTFAVLGAQEKSRLRNTCSPTCSDSEVSTLRTDYLVADISLGVGIVALGLATYFLLTKSGPTDQRLARTIWK
jgi:hypothetical protein